MGTDIIGLIEFKERGKIKWRKLKNVGRLLDRNYDSFGCLFGVRNSCNFKPISYRRGVPDDCCDDAIEYKDNRKDIGFHDQTYITLEEINNINWEEETEDYDERLSYFEKNENGIYKYKSKSFINPDLWSGKERDLLEKEKKFEKGNYKFEYQKFKRKDVISNDWLEVFELMRKYANEYDIDPKEIRLIVAFWD